MTAPLAPRQPRLPFGRWVTGFAWRHVVGVLALIFALFPVWFVVLAAFSPVASLSGQRLSPEAFTLRQYHRLVDHYPFWRWFFNSLFISVTTAFLTVLLAACAAYALAAALHRAAAGAVRVAVDPDVPGVAGVRGDLLMVLNLPNVFPGSGRVSVVTIVLLLPGGALGANAWLIKGFFDTIPKSLDESARIDGASHSQVFWLVIMPLGLPVLAIIFLLSFISSQAEFLVANVVLFGIDKASPNNTVATGLQGLLAGDRYDMNWVRSRSVRCSRRSPSCCCSSSCSASSSVASPPVPSRSSQTARRVPLARGLRWTLVRRVPLGRLRHRDHDLVGFLDDVVAFLGSAGDAAASAGCAGRGTALVGASFASHDHGDTPR